VLLRVEVSRELRLGLEAHDLIGFERSAVAADREMRPEIWAGLLEVFQDALLDGVCGARRAPLIGGARLRSGVRRATASEGSGGGAAVPGAGSCSHVWDGWS
jgi:hypothetical protein